MDSSLRATGIKQIFRFADWLGTLLFKGQSHSHLMNGFVDICLETST